MTTPEKRKEMELNQFARFFGAVLVELKKSYERQRQDQENASRPYSKEFGLESKIDFITYVW